MSIDKYLSDKYLFKSCTAAGLKHLGQDTTKGEIYLETKNGIKTIVDKYYWVFVEIFCDNQYEEYKKHISDDHVIFDLGANRGYSALLFAKETNTKHIYAFEPNQATYSLLRRNVDFNPSLSSKITSFNYGLSNASQKRVFYTHPGSDGISTTEMDFVDSYWKQRKDELVVQEVEMKKASIAINEIVAANNIQIPLVLKIDIEGGEYDVLQELKDSQTLQKFTMIFGECHLGMQGILDICLPTFKCVYMKTSKREGVCDFVLVKA